MLSACVLFSLLALAAGVEPIMTDYHRVWGIPAAERMRAAEAALDFDGGRIHGGTFVGAGSVPHLAGLVITLSTGQTSVCGSSLLTNTRALTAAHCWLNWLTPARSLTIVFGSDRLFSGGTRITTSTVAWHASYNPNTLANDVAVISHTWVTYTNTINRIAIATGTNNFAGQWAVAAGFGSYGDNQAITTNQAKKRADMQVITNAVCQASYGSIVLASTLCARGNNNHSICPGDSGGPLAVGSTLIGVSSFVSARGCSIGMPAGFARVSSFATWIQARL